MRNEKELMRSHAEGFGGSDAAMVLQIAKKIKSGQPLTTTQRRRLRVIKGLEFPQPSFDTETTKAGHDFEDKVGAEILCSGIHWEREAKLDAEVLFDNFKAFAHADFYNREMNAVKECKWSRKFDIAGLQMEYAAQLQWYYLMGAFSVSLNYDTADGTGCVNIQQNPKLIAELGSALVTIDNEWDKLDLNITEFTGADVPKRAVVLVDLLKNLKAKKAELEAQIEDVSGKLLTQMSEQNHTKYSGEGWSVSRIDACIAKKFDIKKFAADHADMYAAYLKDSKRAASLRVEFKEKKENKQNYGKNQKNHS